MVPFLITLNEAEPPTILTIPFLDLLRTLYFIAALACIIIISIYWRSALGWGCANATACIDGYAYHWRLSLHTSFELYAGLSCESIWPTAILQLLRVVISQETTERTINKIYRVCLSSVKRVRYKTMSRLAHATSAELCHSYSRTRMPNSNTPSWKGSG